MAVPRPDVPRRIIGEGSARPHRAGRSVRRPELRADEHAAALGFAPQLMAVLCEEHDRERSERAAATAAGLSLGKEGVLARLLASHPDVHTRLHHLHARSRNRR
ncbi:hypothetical protein [Streptomyces sp. NPDC048385]|uniref:hypothetical protein n=1 Tax=unclassified Streptomyces TaxID=2593676 RepID=UPI00342D2EF4